jgi:hypothetical protein
MAANPESLARVAARIREVIGDLVRVQSALTQALERWGPEDQDPVTVHWVGGLLHDFYTAVEKAFREISPELNGHEPKGENWHRDLLHTMTLDLPGFRPAVLSRTLETRLLEHLKFRHVYRNLYTFDLKWDRVRRLAEDAFLLIQGVMTELGQFGDALDEMAQRAGTTELDD